MGNVTTPRAATPQHIGTYVCVGVGCVPRYHVVVTCPVIPARGEKHAHLMNGSTTYYSSAISQKPGQSFLVTSSLTARDNGANDGITGTFGFSALGSRSHHGPIFHYDDDYYHPSPSPCPSTSRQRPTKIDAHSALCYDAPQTGVSQPPPTASLACSWAAPSTHQ